MLNTVYEPNGALRSFINHIEYHEKNDKSYNIARKQERPQRFIKSFPRDLNDAGPKLKKYFWLDKYCPEVIRPPYDPHNDLNFSPLRFIQDKPVQVGHKLVRPSEIKPLRYGR